MTDSIPDAWLAQEPLPLDPLPIVKKWLDEAFARGVQANPHAVALATVDSDGRPSVRMVLCNAIDTERGAFTMYTNLESRKGRALAHDPRAAIVFHWESRQVRIEGVTSLTPDAECDAYFATRPLEARLGAWASKQSESIESRDAMLAKLLAATQRFDAHSEEDVVPRPAHWGGYTLIADRVELWVSRPGRIHDRALWRREASGWSPQRLQP